MPETNAVAGPRGHEDSRFRATRIVVFTAALLAAVLVALGVASLMVRLPSGSAVGPSEREPGDGMARLQSAPAKDLAAYRASKAAELESYRWLDKSAGLAQIPIERAMAILAGDADGKKVSPLSRTQARSR